jgi:hypothetical protein
MRWLVSCFVIGIVFGAIYAGYQIPSWLEWLPDWIKSLLYALGPEIENVTRTPITPYYFSIVTLTTLGFGDVSPQNIAGEIWVILEVVLGYVMLGGLVGLFTSKISERSG